MSESPDTTALTTLSDGASLRMAIFRLARRLRAHRAVDAMSDAQFAVLGALHKHGPFTIGQLAARERVAAPSMTRTVNGLEESGYLTRTADAADGRKVVITLTATGDRTVTETLRKRDAWLEDALSDLDQDEHDVLIKAAAIMRKLADR